jgi:hypothetical protein
MLFIAGRLTAYEAHKHYLQLFGKVSQRNVYYQLERGAKAEQFERIEVQEKGDFSWGDVSRKVYYEIKSKEGISLDTRIREYFTKVNL